MKKDKFKLDISQEKIRFESHLASPNNNKIIFSGIFGIGKTYFLNNFFESERKNYEAIFISPVNYSISNNDDIINYIKYDIIFQLLSKGIDFEKTDFSKGLTSQMYVKENFKEIMTILAENASKINKVFSVIFNSLSQIQQKIEEHHNEVNVDEEKELRTFLEEITKKTGTIYEENRITILVSKLIEGLKADGKEIVLVIDDTDRLDPEHIFRILNVFACHFEFNSTVENKFGFDKVILVCDIDNIRKMFHSKYGQEVDFSGYVDKFFSQEIFSFDNKEIIISSIGGILNSIVKENGAKLFDINEDWMVFLKKVLLEMIKIDSINLRSLLKINESVFDFKRYKFRKGDRLGISQNNQYNIVLMFDFLVYLFGSKTNLSDSIKKLSKRVSYIYIGEHDKMRYGDLIVFLDYDNHIAGESNYLYIEESIDLRIKYTLQGDNWSDKYYALITEINNLNDIEKRIFPLYQLLEFSFEKYKELKVVD